MCVVAVACVTFLINSNFFFVLFLIYFSGVLHGLFLDSAKKIN